MGTSSATQCISYDNPDLDASEAFLHKEVARLSRAGSSSSLHNKSLNQSTQRLRSKTTCNNYCYGKLSTFNNESDMESDSVSNDDGDSDTTTNSDNDGSVSDDDDNKHYDTNKVITISDVHQRKLVFSKSERKRKTKQRAFIKRKSAQQTYRETITELQIEKEKQATKLMQLKFNFEHQEKERLQKENELLRKQNELLMTKYTKQQQQLQGNNNNNNNNPSPSTPSQSESPTISYSKITPRHSMISALSLNHNDLNYKANDINNDDDENLIDDNHDKLLTNLSPEQYGKYPPDSYLNSPHHSSDCSDSPNAAPIVDTVLNAYDDGKNKKPLKPMLTLGIGHPLSAIASQSASNSQDNEEQEVVNNDYIENLMHSNSNQSTVSTTTKTRRRCKSETSALLTLTTSKTSSNGINVWQTQFDDKCTSISSCIVIKRLILALKWYSNCNGNAEILFDKIKKRNYDKALISDYNHLITVHLSHGNIMDISKERKLIKYEIYKNIGNQCISKNCVGEQRKQIYNQNDDNNNNNDIPYYIRYLDTIHCHFMHTTNNK